MVDIKAFDIFKDKIKGLPGLQNEGNLFEVDGEGVNLQPITKLEHLQIIAKDLGLEVEYQSLKTNILADEAIKSGTDYSKLLEKQLEELKKLMEQKRCYK